MTARRAHVGVCARRRLLVALDLGSGAGLGALGGTAVALGPASPGSGGSNCQAHSSPAFCGHLVCGPILAKYHALGGPSSFLGYPVTDETGTPDGVRRFNYFSTMRPSLIDAGSFPSSWEHCFSSLAPSVSSEEAEVRRQLLGPPLSSSSALVLSPPFSSSLGRRSSSSSSVRMALPCRAASAGFARRWSLVGDQGCAGVPVRNGGFRLRGTDARFRPERPRR